ncbi:MAG TPA: UDP-glucose 4-epimerase GalE [Oscillospiraceae bacterium]|nr:UDP-glucose 4-epimerase GalE [Oscillospiraceae bacterium]
MSILVTGGMGYIGSHTCVELLNAGREVVVADNLSNSSAEAGNRVRQITGKPVKFYRIDLRDRPALDRIFEENRIDAVLHFAGLKAVGESVSMPLEYYDNNLGAAITLCESMRAHAVKKILFSSSATVYDIGKELPIRETSPRGNCTNPYSWSKYMVEQILRDTAKADPEWSVMLLRYFNPVGAHESGLIGEDPRGIPNNLMPYICRVAVGQYPYLNVWGGDYQTPDGTGVRDYIHVVDLAKGHPAAMEYMDHHPGESAFNLGTGCGHSVLEVVSAFEKASGVRIPYKIEPRRPGDLDIFYASPDKSVEELGWKVERSLADMCRDCWNWQSKNPFGYGE